MATPTSGDDRSVFHFPIISSVGGTYRLRWRSEHFKCEKPTEFTFNAGQVFAGCPGSVKQDRQ